MAVVCRSRISDIHTKQCRITWRGDFTELHARIGLLTLDLDDRTIMLSAYPVCMHPIAREFAVLLASGFALAPACGGYVIESESDDLLLEATQIGETVALRFAMLPNYRVIVRCCVLRAAITTFLREFR